MKPKSEPMPGMEGAPDSKVDWNGAPLEWPRHSGNLERLKAALEVRKKRQRRRRAQAAAGAALLLFVGFAWQFSERAMTPTATVGRAIVTLPDSRILPDGTIVELKDRSEISVDYAGALRRVVLRRGEAHFQVTKNPARAFVVEAGGVEFRAVGTAFAVGLRAGAVEMIVTEGSVAVDSKAGSRGAGDSAGASPHEGGNSSSSVPWPSSAIVVEAGNRVVVELAAAAAILPPLASVPVSAAESGEKLAWRVPRLEFNETRLSEAVTAINRHSGWRLTLAEAALGRVEISGALRADNVEPLLRMLENNFNIRSERRPDGEIMLRQGAAPASSR